MRSRHTAAICRVWFPCSLCTCLCGVAQLRAGFPSQIQCGQAAPGPVEYLYGRCVRYWRHYLYRERKIDTCTFRVNTTNRNRSACTREDRIRQVLLSAFSINLEQAIGTTTGKNDSHRPQATDKQKKRPIEAKTEVVARLTNVLRIACIAVMCIAGLRRYVAASANTP